MTYKQIELLHHIIKLLQDRTNKFKRICEKKLQQIFQLEIRNHCVNITLSYSLFYFKKTQ